MSMLEVSDQTSDDSATSKNYASELKKTRETLHLRHAVKLSVFITGNKIAEQNNF